MNECTFAMSSHPGTSGFCTMATSAAGIDLEARTCRRRGKVIDRHLLKRETDKNRESNTEDQHVRLTARHARGNRDRPELIKPNVKMASSGTSKGGFMISGPL